MTIKIVFLFALAAVALGHPLVESEVRVSDATARGELPACVEEYFRKVFSEASVELLSSDLAELEGAKRVRRSACRFVLVRDPMQKNVQRLEECI